MLDGGTAKECVGRLTKLHRDLGSAGGEVLAGTQIEWHAGPTPVVDAELERNIGFGSRVRRDLRLVPVIAGLSAEHNACAVLAAYGISGRDRMDGLKQLRLLAAHGIGIE